ncbi:MAG: CDP-alcohol phosphatidyltransferase family protein [Candidatus Micrarchaeales archaeon]
MRKCDFITILRIFLVIFSVMLLFYYNFIGLILIPFVFFLDFLDGFFAKSEEEKEYGKRLDVAGDRITEYLYYFFLSIKNLIPIFILPIIIIRNSLVDSFFYTPKKNFSTAKTKIARIFSSSRFSRALYGFLKMLMFFYFSSLLFFRLPLIFGYALLAIVVAFSLIRGASDIYEALK